MMRMCLVIIVSIGACLASSFTPARSAGSPPQYAAVNIHFPGWPYVTYGDCCGYAYTGNPISAQGVVVGTAYRTPNSTACGNNRAFAFYSATGKYLDLGKRFRNSNTRAIGIFDDTVAVAVTNCSSRAHIITQASLQESELSWSKPCICNGYYLVGINSVGIGLDGNRPAILSWIHGKPNISRLPYPRGSDVSSVGVFGVGDPIGFVGTDEGNPVVWLDKKEYVLPVRDTDDNRAFGAVARQMPSGLEVDVVGLGSQNSDLSPNYFWIGHKNSTGNGFTFTDPGAGYIPYPAMSYVTGISPDASVVLGLSGSGPYDGAVWYRGLGSSQSDVYTANNLMSNFVSSTTCTWWKPGHLLQIEGADASGGLLVRDSRHLCLLEPQAA